MKTFYCRVTRTIEGRAVITAKTKAAAIKKLMDARYDDIVGEDEVDFEIDLGSLEEAED
jgi:hypothetical protein